MGGIVTSRMGKGRCSTISPRRHAAASVSIVVADILPTTAVTPMSSAFEPVTLLTAGVYRRREPRRDTAA